MSSEGRVCGARTTKLYDLYRQKVTRGEVGGSGMSGSNRLPPLDMPYCLLSDCTFSPAWQILATKPTEAVIDLAV